MTRVAALLPVSWGTLAELSVVVIGLIRGSCSISYHPIHACAHSCLDRCVGGVGVGSVGGACPVLSLCGPGVHDDGMMPVWMDLIH